MGLGEIAGAEICVRCCLLLARLTRASTGGYDI